MPTKIDDLIDDIFPALPATTAEEIAIRVSKTRNAPVSAAEVENALAHLRKNIDYYRWGVPHIARGKPNVTSVGRLFALAYDNLNNDQLTDAEREHIRAGTISMLTGIKTQMANHRSMAQLLLKYEPSKNVRKHLNWMIREFKYAGERIDEWLEEIAA